MKRLYEKAGNCIALCSLFELNERREEIVLENINLRQRSLLNDKYLVSSSTLIGPLEPSQAPLARGRSQAHLESRIGEIKAKFLVLYESFDRRRTRMWSEIRWTLWNCCDSRLFLLRRELWPAIDGVVCFSFFLEGETTTSNNFAKWCWNGFKFGTGHKEATHLR